MLRLLNSIVCIALALALVGSLVPVKQALAAPKTNPIAGSWSGTFTTSVGGFGPITMEISKGGSLVGDIENLANGVTGPLVGQIDKKGRGTAVLIAAPDLIIPYHLEVSIDANGDLVGAYVAHGTADFFGQFIMSRD